jgi:RNA polymerase primary sigma factor
MIGKIKEASKQFAKREGRDPNYEEISEMVDIDPERVENLWNLNEPAVSLDSEVSENGATLEDVLPHEETPSPREVAMDGQMKSRVQEALQTLSERERKILSLRFGFSSKKGLSLRNTSAYVGLSQEGVRRVEKKALEKLARGPMQSEIAELL